MLPPLSALRVFESAARLGSFTRAAQELGMTQAAVSYQIKVLEERVGSALFIRHARGVDLSDVGLRLSPQTSEAFDLLRDAFSVAVGRAQETLVLSVVPSFATNVLAQRVGQFQFANPTISVRVDVSQTIVDFNRGDFDLAVRSGFGEWPGMKSHLLVPAVFTPMLSPDLIGEAGGVHRPADLLKYPIIGPSDPWWPHWFEAAGVPHVDLEGRPDLQLGSQVLDANAAIAGQGIAILTPALYRDAIEQGRLYQPFDLTCDEGKAYWLVYPESRRNSAKIKLFRNWITNALGLAD